MSAIIREPVTKKMLLEHAAAIEGIAKVTRRGAADIRRHAADELLEIAREQRAAVAEMEADK
jgi:hypothetical protein